MPKTKPAPEPIEPGDTEFSKPTMRRCIGYEKFGLPAHEAPIGDFPAQPSQKDGLGRMCREHWTQYTRALRTGSIEAAPARRTSTEAAIAREAAAKAKPGRNVTFGELVRLAQAGTAASAGRKPKQSAAEKAMRVPIVHAGETEPAPALDQEDAEAIMADALDNAAEAEIAEERRARIMADQRAGFERASAAARAAAAERMEV